MSSRPDTAAAVNDIPLAEVIVGGTRVAELSAGATMLRPHATTSAATGIIRNTRTFIRETPLQWVDALRPTRRLISVSGRIFQGPARVRMSGAFGDRRRVARRRRVLDAGAGRQGLIH